MIYGSEIGKISIRHRKFPWRASSSTVRWWGGGQGRGGNETTTDITKRDFAIRRRG